MTKRNPNGSREEKLSHHLTSLHLTQTQTFPHIDTRHGEEDNQGPYKFVVDLEVDLKADMDFGDGSGLTSKADGRTWS